MERKGEMELFNFIPILWKNRRFIIVTTCIAAVLAAVASLLQPNYYKSSTTFYPVNASLLEPSLQINEKSIAYYGDDRDIDRLLTIAKSNDLIESLIEQEGLAGHYQISTETNKSKVRLFKKVKKLYSVLKTEYDAIELSVEDIDPKKAMAIAIAARKLIDTKAISIVNQSQLQILENTKSTLAAKNQQLSTISDSLNVLRQRFGIYDITTQAEALATLEINAPQNRSVQQKIENYRKGVTQITNLLAQQEDLNKGIAEDAIQVQQIEASLKNEVSAMHVIEEAYLPIEKSRPRRSLIVLGIALLTLFFTSCLVLIRDNLSKLEFE